MALGISHGQRTVFVSARGSSVIVWATVDLPDEFRNRLATLDVETQEKLLLTVEHALLSYGRTGFNLDPPSPRLISEVKRFTVEQTVRLSKGDSSSFNRYGDAIQEVVTAAVRVVVFLQPASQPPTTSEGTADAKPPSGMYA